MRVRGFWGAGVLLPLSVVIGGGCSSGGAAAEMGGACTPPPAAGAGWNLGHGPLDPAAVAKAAVMIASCVPDDDPHTYFKDWYFVRGDRHGRFLSWVDCVAARSDGCQAVKDCLGVSFDLGGPCDVGCSGSVAQYCDDSLRLRADCAKLHARCEAGEGCVPCDAGASCTSTTERCDGQTLVRCDGGREVQGHDCGALGLQCDTMLDFTGEPYATCRGPGAACSVDPLLGSAPLPHLHGDGCQGNTLTACVQGKLFDIDCGQIGVGFSCQSFDGKPFCGLGSECDGSVSNDSVDAVCDATKLVVCNAGVFTKVDCKAIGFSDCDPAIGRCR